MITFVRDHWLALLALAVVLWPFALGAFVAWIHRRRIARMRQQAGARPQVKRPRRERRAMHKAAAREGWRKVGRV